ncbi:MAG: hypothetical protein ACR2PA_05990 [Hyphomicrobiaceae bacterium]
MIREGFWSRDPNAQPWPVANIAPWEGQEDFLADLMRVEARVIPLSFRGWSNCRLCSKPNGSREYRTDDAEWPEGLWHYVADHNVKPSQEFVDYIAERASEVR